LVWGSGQTPQPPTPKTPIPNPQSPKIKLNLKKISLIY